MSFRRKNISITPSNRSITAYPQIPTEYPTKPQATPPTATLTTVHYPPGTRPSPLNGHPTTSTGTPTLDALLSPHSALPLGTSFLIEEPGQTDFASALLRYYAAEGITQGHELVVIGCGESWVRELPGVLETKDVEEGGGRRGAREAGLEERMKIAWRYERLGQFGSGIGGSGRVFDRSISGVGVGDIHGAGDTGTTTTEKGKTSFCHTFDLTKRLEIHSLEKIHFIQLPPPFTIRPDQNPFKAVLEKLYGILQSKKENDTTTIYRVVIPNLLSPAIYPPHTCQPRNIIQFVHSLRALLRTYSQKLTVMGSFPLELYPRQSSLVRWIEHLCDGVLELTPLPQLMEMASRSTKGKEDIPQGLVKLWKLPLASERGDNGGSAGGYVAMGDDLAFTVTRKRFSITAFSLPPLDEGEAGENNKGTIVGAEDDDHGKTTKVNLDF